MDYKKGKVVKQAVETLEEAGKRAPKLFGIPTGIEGLDDLFFTTKIEDGKPKKVPLGGIPSLAVVNLTGVSDTGKSLMAEQFAVKQASLGYRVCFVTVESPATFVASGLKERAKAMGIEWADIEDNIILIDAATHASIREDIENLLATLEYAVSSYDTKSVVIDSITGFFEAREMMARSIVRKLFNFMKQHYQTAIFVSQKRSGHEELTAEAAGGYAISHIVDCSIVLSKELIMSKYAASLYKKPIGSIVRLFRIDGCRMCGHDTRTHIFEITETGLVKIGPALDEIIKMQS
jgi:KaiC domain protein